MSTLLDKHQVLLNDQVRMRAYERAIRQLVQPGMIVADLGCGLGVLAFAAARAGAARIHAVEVEPDTLRIARNEAVRAGLADRIVFHEGLAQELAVPERVDLVITETLGSLGLDENILPLLIDARKHWLKPDGTLCPHAIALTVVPTVHHSPAGGATLRHEPIAPADFLATPSTSPRLEFAQAADCDFLIEPRFSITRDAALTGFAGWFTVWLTPPEGGRGDTVQFGTAPDQPATHWEQAFLPLRKPVALRAGQTLDLILGIGPDDTGLQSVTEFNFAIA